MIFQDPMTSLNPVLTIGRQIREALETHFGLDRKARGRARRRAARPGRDPEREAAGSSDYPHQFSGGMRQRAMIAMALACEPKLLIADEPTTALDVTIQAQILELLRELVAERDTALILITHDLGVVAGMCERVNVMYAGMFVETGDRRRALRAAAASVHARAAAERAAARRAARRASCSRSRARRATCSARRRRARSQPRCRYEVDAVAAGGAAARRDRARPLRRVLQPRARPTSGSDASARRPHERRRRAARRGRRPQGLVPDQERRRARPPRRRHQGGRRRVVRRSGAARRSGSSASRAAASRRSGARSSASTSRPTARIVFDGQDITHARARASCGRSAGGCRWSSRTRSPRSTRATASAGSSASRCASTASRAAAQRRAASASCSSVVGLPARRGLPLPARVLGRPAPADRPRPRARGEPGLHRLPTSRSRRSTSRSRRRSSTCSRRCRSEFELTYLFIAHDLAVVRHISDRIAVMYLGTIVEVSPADELYDNPLHPYTISLLSAVPIPDPEVERAARAILLAGRPAEPREPADGVPLPHALPVRPADALPRRGAAAPRARGRPHGRVPLGRADQGRRARSRTADRAGLRARRRPRNGGHVPPSDVAAADERAESLDSG